MWLLYSTLGEPNAEENALFLGDVPVYNRQVSWVDVRRRAQGLVRVNEPCFVWNGDDWGCVCTDHDVVTLEDDKVIRIKLPPLNGAQLKLSQQKKSATENSSSNTKRAASSGLSSIVPPFDAKATEKVLSDVADTAKKMSSFMGAAITSWAKTASDTVLEAAGDKKLEQIGQVKLRVGKKIADGGFSEVYVAKGPNNESYALKKCRAQTSEQLSQLKREIAAHETLMHESHILQLLASEISDEGRFSVVRFVFPLCDGGSWFDVIPKVTSEDEVLRIFLQASHGLKAMHIQNLLHRDVKPHNILLMENGHAVLMDLGSSCPLPILIPTKSAAALLAEEAAEFCSAPYRAPELWEPKMNRHIGEEADVWSMGCTLFAASFGRGYSPYEDPIQGVLKLAILNGSPVKFPPTRAYSDFIVNLISRMVTSAPRLSLDDVIREVESHLNNA